MEHRAPAGVGHGGERTQQRHIVQDHAGIGLIHLEGEAAGGHGRGNLGQPLRLCSVPGRDGHVQAVVDRHLAVGLGLAQAQRLQHGLPGLGSAKSMKVVVPPQAAAMLPSRKLSVLTSPANGICR